MIFLQNGVLMRAQEAVLEVEYFLAVVPPDTQQALPHDDWCACSALAGRVLMPPHTALYVSA